MKDNYKKAYAEVLEILKNTEKEIVEKIPQNFISFLQKEKDDSYVVNIDFYDENWENSVLKETLAIIALIYRDYIVSKEEREKLIQEENKEIQKMEAELREKYNPDNLFKKDKSNATKKENGLDSYTESDEKTGIVTANGTENNAEDDIEDKSSAIIGNKTNQNTHEKSEMLENVSTKKKGLFSKIITALINFFKK